jgi:hypothetical protein
MKTTIVVPWHNKQQRDAFLAAWNVENIPNYLLLQQDEDKEGCALTKNRGIRNAIDKGADVVVVLDDDCFPESHDSLESLIDDHLDALEPQPCEAFQVVTKPPSRGTPYFNRTPKLEVAASMGFWTGIGDYDAPGQLVYGAKTPMMFKQGSIFGRFFPLCGMNLAFRAKWWPWCQFVDVPRFDDIWQGFLWQKKAYAMGCCFNLNGPLIRHARQSNVWANLRDEVQNLERNETFWQEVNASESLDYDELVGLIKQNVTSEGSPPSRIENKQEWNGDSLH